MRITKTLFATGRRGHHRSNIKETSFEFLTPELLHFKNVRRNPSTQYSGVFEFLDIFFKFHLLIKVDSVQTASA